MKLQRVICAILSFLTLVSVFSACTGEKTTDTTANTEPVTEAVTEDPYADDDLPTGVVNNEKPKENDGNFEKLLAELIASGDIKQNKGADEKLTRIEFAYNVVYASGYVSQFTTHLCKNIFSDMEKYSEDMKNAEIAVLQGFMMPVEGEFKPNDPISYGEVVRGLLYVLGYRQYAEQQNVLKLGIETGLTNCIERSTKFKSEITFGTFAQLMSNMLSMNVVQCVEKDGVYTVSKRATDANTKTTYVNREGTNENHLFHIANTGWDIFDGAGYRYGPSILINDDGSIDIWAASNSGAAGEIDWGRMRTSYDGGFSWTADTGAIRPQSASETWYWSCDPGVVKIGDYYYAGITSILYHDGVDNNLFIARSKTKEGAFVEYWDGEGWTGDARAVISHTANRDSWGTGEGSFVVHDGTIYCYTSSSFEYTAVHTAPADDPNWPGKLQFQGYAFHRADGGEDSADIKYVDAYNCFVAVAMSQRFSDKCRIAIYTSFDGITFRREGQVVRDEDGLNILTGSHNMGISGDTEGHIDIFRQQYVGYAHTPEGHGWAEWPTRLTPITWLGADNYGKEDTVVSRDKPATLDEEHTPEVVQIRAESSAKQRIIKVRGAGGKGKFNVYTLDKNLREQLATAEQYAKMTYTYNPEDVYVDTAAHTATLLKDKLARILVHYEGLTSEISIMPATVKNPDPVDFYPEADTVYIMYKTDVAQPAFIAKSAQNDFLMLWGSEASSYTVAVNKDMTGTVLNWEQGIELSGWDESVVSVDEKTGVVTPISRGETTITAKYMGHTASYKLVVYYLDEFGE